MVLRQTLDPVHALAVLKPVKRFGDSHIRMSHFGTPGSLYYLNAEEPNKSFHHIPFKTTSEGLVAASDVRSEPYKILHVRLPSHPLQTGGHIFAPTLSEIVAQIPENELERAVAYSIDLCHFNLSDSKRDYFSNILLYEADRRNARF
ncbi:MAG TPA: hypothetical protein VK158_06025 [Acidobacteriota bacterium]|nr:hypothetical protein [Acidobacteriota bacterium]